MRGRSVGASRRSSAIPPCARERSDSGLGVAGACALSTYPRTASRRVLPALNEGAFEAAIAMLSPVRGLRPWRAPRIFVANVPNPGMATLSSLVSASLMAENTVSTTADACALDSEASVATWDERSDFFITFQAIERVGDLAVVVPGHLLPCRESQNAHA